MFLFNCRDDLALRSKNPIFEVVSCCCLLTVPFLDSILDWRPWRFCVWGRTGSSLDSMLEQQSCSITGQQQYCCLPPGPTDCQPCCCPQLHPTLSCQGIGTTSYAIQLLHSNIALSSCSIYPVELLTWLPLNAQETSEILFLTYKGRIGSMMWWEI